MKSYLAVRPDGTVTAIYNREDDELAPEIEGVDILLAPEYLPCWPSPPFDGPALVFVAGALGWRDDRALDEVKACKRAEINATYQLANKTSFSFAGKEIQANEHSMNQIQVTNGYVAITGGLHPSFPMAWKTLDNGHVAIPDVATWREFYGAIAQTGQDNFDKAQALKAQIDAATTAEQVAAIQWNQPTEVA